MKGAGTPPACAVCKFQRRRCKPDCILAPYFPANEPKAFQNVHRLYGVSNVMKLLKSLETEDQREEAVTSIKYEADIRQRFPVYGCAGIISMLQQDINHHLEELRLVKDQIVAFKQHNNIIDINNNYNVQTPQLPEFYEEDFMMKNQYYFDEHVFNCFDENVFNDASYLGYNYYGGHNYYNNGTISQDYYGMEPRPAVDRMRKSDCVDEDDVEEEVDDDHKQPYIQTKEEIKSRVDSYLQETRRGEAYNITNNDLKNAASSFTLTNTNCL